MKPHCYRIVSRPFSLTFVVNTHHRTNVLPTFVVNTHIRTNVLLTFVVNTHCRTNVLLTFVVNTHNRTNVSDGRQADKCWCHHCNIRKVGYTHKYTLGTACVNLDEMSIAGVKRIHNVVFQPLEVCFSFGPIKFQWFDGWRTLLLMVCLGYY